MGTVGGPDWEDREIEGRGDFPQEGTARSHPYRPSVDRIVQYQESGDEDDS